MAEMARYEILVELQVTDEREYAQYREAMTPLLEACGGEFRRDFRVGEVLRGPDRLINRVFIISFPDAATKDAFFADEAYRAVRAAHFDQAVSSGAIIAAFNTNPA